jgi:amidase
MVPLAQGTDFGCSIRIPAAFCGIVGIRPTPGLTPNFPMPLAWDPGQVHGALGRDAEDVAFMLDSMVGLSRLSPISVAPPWASALAEVERARDAKGLRVAYVADIAGIGVEAEIATICRTAAHRLRDAGAEVEEIAFDVSDGREPLSGLARPVDGRSAIRESERARTLRAELEGQRSSRPEGDRLDIAAAEQKRLEVFHRFRMLFERFDVLLTPAAPVKPFPWR